MNRPRPVTLCLAGALALTAALTAWAPRRPTLVFAAAFDEPHRLWSAEGESFPPGVVHVLIRHAHFPPERRLRLRVTQIDSAGRPFPVMDEEILTGSNLSFCSLPVEAITPGTWNVHVLLDEREISRGSFVVR